MTVLNGGMNLAGEYIGRRMIEKSSKLREAKNLQKHNYFFFLLSCFFFFCAA